MQIGEGHGGHNLHLNQAKPASLLQDTNKSAHYTLLPVHNWILHNSKPGAKLLTPSPQSTAHPAYMFRTKFNLSKLRDDDTCIGASETRSWFKLKHSLSLCKPLLPAVV